MATHSSTLAWKIPWTEEPSRLQSMGSQSQTRLSNFISLHGKMSCVKHVYLNFHETTFCSLIKLLSTVKKKSVNIFIYTFFPSYPACSSLRFYPFFYLFIYFKMISFMVSFRLGFLPSVLRMAVFFAASVDFPHSS